MKYKMIASDCDDTLLDSYLQISPYTVETIERYIKAGGKFIIATGRMKASVLPYCHVLGLKGEVISYQGAVVSDIMTGKDITQSEISYVEAAVLAEYLERKGLYFQIYDSGGTFFVEKKTDYTEKYCIMCRVPYMELGQKASEFILEYNYNPVKIMVITEESKMPEIRDDLKEKFSDKFFITNSKSWLVEIIPKEINKGTAVALVAEKCGIKKEEIICIGDSMNDLAMIEYAGLGVAMENGDPYVKERADYVCPSNNNDGVAFVIEKFGFLED